VSRFLECRSSDRDYLVAALLLTFFCALICVALDAFGMSERILPLIAGMYIIAIGLLILIHGRSNFKLCRDEAEFLRCNPFWSTNAYGQITVRLESPRKFDEPGVKKPYSTGSLYVVEMSGGGILWLIGLA
jgi:hypothetical protein